MECKREREAQNKGYNRRRACLSRAREGERGRGSEREGERESETEGEEGRWGGGEMGGEGGVDKLDFNWILLYQVLFFLCISSLVGNTKN